MAKKKTEKDLQEEIRQNLESLLGDDPLVGATAPATASNAAQPVANIDSESDLGDKLEHPHAQPMDFHKTKKAAMTDAKRTLKSLMDFYLGNKIIKQNEYVKYKKKVDEMSLSNMMFAIETSQHAIIKLLEEIDMGNTHPRNFEAMASLNSQMMNMIKHQQALFVTMEEGYKKVKHDHESIEAEDRTVDVKAEDVTILDGSFKTRGTKMLMANLQKTIKEDKEDKPEETDEVPRLTDVYNRPENIVPNAPSKRKSKDDGSDEIYGDLDEHF
jgi:hypothetical protein